LIIVCYISTVYDSLNSIALNHCANLFNYKLGDGDIQLRTLNSVSRFEARCGISFFDTTEVLVHGDPQKNSTVCGTATALLRVHLQSSVVLAAARMMSSAGFTVIGTRDSHSFSMQQGSL
jgi:hypothetical protein